MRIDRTRQGNVNIVGAGPTGALLALLLQRRGLDVTLYEARPDPRDRPSDSGRSINLALADRGIHALKLAGIYDDIAATLIPMRGRLIHQQDGSQSFQTYGQRPSEVIYSISRHLLNQALLNVAVQRPGVHLAFGQRLESVDFGLGTLRMRDTQRNQILDVPLHPTLATDGAGSMMRRAMTAAGLTRVEEADLDHGYKELSIPAGSDGRPLLAQDALHIWPRGNFMLIALPNRDATFTATLFLAKHGPVSFEALGRADAINAFLTQHFPDVHALMPHCVAEFQSHPTGSLGTVYADLWHVRGDALLVGDAAHAIVPFHGQGMNCCFEDCVQLASSLDRNPNWQAAFADFQTARKPNTDAIAAMALENYLEMRERVAEPQFQLQQALALELERSHPDRFIPRYSMVMFHHEIDYQTAQQRGRIQAELLAELTTTAHTLADIDFARAARELERRLPRLGLSSTQGAEHD